MGTVYAAYDPSLDRRVALKFLRAIEGDRGDVREKRLLREAQAMARLSHPNVAVVYEVGSFEGHVFLAMELVDGMDLRSWLAASPRSFAQILDAFRAAGRGLATAHAAGIIHRDFKPENVLVDRHDRPRVADFGLSRAPGDPADEPEGSTDGATTPLSAPSHLSTPLTATGGVLGTLSYMAPEQHAGAAVDARSDQFSFCVALHEALHGERPFPTIPGQSMGEAIAAPAPAASASSAVPRWCRQALARGLALDRDDRFASMDELLAALTPPVSRRWQVALGAALALAVTGAAAYAFVADRTAAPPGPRCDLGAQRLAGVWDQPVKSRLRDAFLRTRASGADTTWAAFSAIVDQRAGAWVSMHDEACAATHVSGQQSPAVLDLRMECLDRKRQEMKDLVDVYSERADASALDRVVAAADKLSAVAACADVANLRAVSPLPEDLAVRARVRSLRGRLGRSRALGEAGRYQQGREYMQSLAKEAEAVGYAPLVAEAANALATHLRLAGKFEEAEQSFFAAANHAVEGRDWSEEAEAWLGLVANYGQEGVVVEGRVAARAAELAVRRANGDESMRAELETGIGRVENLAGSFDQALQHFRRAEELLKRSLGARSLRYADVLGEIARVLSNLGQNREGLVQQERALGLRRELLRPDHPDIAASLYGVAYAYTDLGLLQKGLRIAEQSYEIRRRELGPEHPLTIRSRQLIAGAERDLGQHDRAIKDFQDVLAIRKRVLHPDDKILTVTYASLADAERRAGRLDEAERDFRRSIEHEAQAGTPGDVGTGWALIGLGRIGVARRLHRQAVRDCRRALEILSRSYGVDSNRLVEVRECLGEALIGIGDLAAAREQLERAIDSIHDGEHGPEVGAVARFQLARALWGKPADRLRALELAHKTLDALATFEGDRRELKQQITTWLTSREKPPGPHRLTTTPP